MVTTSELHETEPSEARGNRWSGIASRALDGERPSVDEALSVLQAGDNELLALLDAAFWVRRRFFGKKVKLNMLVNAKCGHCPEDCGYCSQSSVSKAAISRHTMLEKDEIIGGAHKALERKAGTYCIVASGRGPTDRELEHVIAAVAEIKRTMPLKICACLGILRDGQAERLKAAGVDRYNHNINTSASHHDKITTTHGYDDRARTLEKVKAAGISPCSGVIVGMGESDMQIVEMAFALRELDADSIPVNFLHPVAGTPLANRDDLSPMRCLKVLALFRFVCPTKEIRASGGREVNLRSLQPLALYPANSIFIGDYLTTDGQEDSLDHKMIEDLGFEVEICAL